MIDQIRTRITCSRTKGKEKSVKTAMDRYFRIDKRVWIKSQPGWHQFILLIIIIHLKVYINYQGYHHHLYYKPLEKRFLSQQPLLVGDKESKMLERMAGRYYKKLKLENFVDPPFSYYQSYARSIKNRNKDDTRPHNVFP